MLTPVKKTRKRRKKSIAAVVRQALIAGKTNLEILEIVKTQFPDSKVQPHSISWYRTKLRQEGVPTLSNFGARNLQRQVKADATNEKMSVKTTAITIQKKMLASEENSLAQKKPQGSSVIVKSSNLPAIKDDSPPAVILDYRSVAMDHVRVVASFFERYHHELHKLSYKMSDMFAQGNCLFLCGNGGSACDAMHLAGEFVGRFKRERRALPAIALSADSGILTAIANDYDFTRVFARQLEGFAQQDDMLIALSTSGRSPNVLAAIETAKENGVLTILFTGRKGEQLAANVDYGFVVDSEDTARIQECYMTALHALTEGIENLL